MTERWGTEQSTYLDWTTKSGNKSQQILVSLSKPIQGVLTHTSSLSRFLQKYLKVDPTSCFFFAQPKIRDKPNLISVFTRLHLSPFHRVRAFLCCEKNVNNLSREPGYLLSTKRTKNTPLEAGFIDYLQHQHPTTTIALCRLEIFTNGLHSTLKCLILPINWASLWYLVLPGVRRILMVAVYYTGPCPVFYHE